MKDKETETKVNAVGFLERMCANGKSADALSDGELASALKEKVWANFDMSCPEAALLCAAIDRLESRPATMEDRALDEMIKAAEHMDWIQVVLNGGPPCFHLDDDGRFCGRAEQWEGHGEFHEFKPLDALLREAGRVK